MARRVEPSFDSYGDTVQVLADQRPDGWMMLRRWPVKPSKVAQVRAIWHKREKAYTVQ